MSSVLLLAAQHPPHHGAHGAAMPGGAHPPQLRTGSFADYVRPEDYPQAALAARQVGTVGFRLGVAPNGRVVSCTVARSSGSSILDASTCRILRSRLRFEPATDARGRPVEGSVSGEYQWVLPSAAQR